MGTAQDMVDTCVLSPEKAASLFDFSQLNLFEETVSNNRLTPAVSLILDPPEQVPSRHRRRHRAASLYHLSPPFSCSCHLRPPYHVLANSSQGTQLKSSQQKNLFSLLLENACPNVQPRAGTLLPRYCCDSQAMYQSYNSCPCTRSQWSLPQLNPS